MKKTKMKLGIICMIIFFLIGGIYLVFLNKKTQDSSSSLADSQNIENILIEKREIPFSPERLEQLTQIQEIHEKQINQYQQTLENILNMSGYSLNEELQTSIENILQEHLSVEDFVSTIERSTGILLLRSDARNLQDSYLTYTRENIIHSDRLISLSDVNRQDIKKREQELMELSLELALNNTDIHTNTQNRIIQSLMTRLYQDDIFFESELSMKRNILNDNLRLTLSRNTNLRGNELVGIIEDILSSLSELGIVQKKEISSEDSAFFGPLFYLSAHAETPSEDSYASLILDSIRFISSLPEDELTDTRKRILHLQIDILVDLTIQDTITSELAYTRGEISYGELENIRTQNFTILEEILILKSNIDNPTGVISLDEIQGFQLGSYTDDSSEILNLDPLAYIQSKSGYIIVGNLNGSNKLGTSNMLLYSGYTIETLSNSEVTLVFTDESILRLEPNTRVTLSGEPSAITTRVNTGSIWSRIVRPIISGDRFIIEGNGIALGVRGTSLYFSSVDQEVFIVDSHSDEGSVEIIGSSQILTSGNKINISDPTIISPVEFSRQELLNNNPVLGDYLRDDIKRLTLLLDDRRRGFNNNPLSNISGDETYLERLEQEIENSLPSTQTESSLIFRTSSIQNTPVNNMSLDNIYQKILQDKLIYAVENSSNNSSQINTKRNAILGANLSELTNIENKRDLERRYELGLAQDIITSPISSSSQIESLIDDFPISTREQERELLEKAGLELASLLNNGEKIVKGSFNLNINLENGISVENWRSSNYDIINIEDDQAIRMLSSDQSASVVLTVTLRLGSQSIVRDYAFELLAEAPSPMEELQAAAQYIINYMRHDGNGPLIFTDTAVQLIPNQFSKNNLITPIIEFDTENKYILSLGGEYKLPSYNDFEENNDNYIHGDSNQRYTYTEIGFTLRHPDNSDIYRLFGVVIKLGNERCEGYGKLLIPASGGPDSSCYSLVASADFNSDLNLRDRQSVILPELRAPITKGDNLTILPELTAEAQDFIHVIEPELSLAMVAPGIEIAHSLTAEQEVAKAEIDDLTQTTLSSLTQYEGLNKEFVDINNSLIRVDGETGVLVRRTEGSSLSYDLSNLNLGEDWAIEMSVRGEDLRREGNFVLFGLNDDFRMIFFRQDNNNQFWSILGPDIQPQIGISGFDNFVNIKINRDTIYLNNEGYSLGNIPNNISNIDIGHFNKLNQWNGIIKNIKMYKK